MALTATVEPIVKNVRLQLDVPATAATVTLSRVGPSGTPATVRNYSAVPVTGGTVLIARDFEAPIGVPITYTAESRNAGGAVISSVTAAITVPDSGCGEQWLTDLVRAGNTQRVVIESLPELAYPVPATVHDVLSRRSPIVASDIAHTPEFDLSFLTATDTEREQATFTLGNAIPVLLRTSPSLGIGNLYFSVLEYSEERIVADGTVQDRRFVVHGRQVQRPDPRLYTPQAPVTYSYVKATFATYAILKAQRVSYDAVAYDWAGSTPDDVFPWPPDDV